MKVTCTDIDCPERTGGECKYKQHMKTGGVIKNKSKSEGKLKELDVITITGTVVNVYDKGRAIEVEVVSDDGMESVLFSVETEGLQYKIHTGEETVLSKCFKGDHNFKFGSEDRVFTQEESASGTRTMGNYSHSIVISVCKTCGVVVRTKV